MTGPMEKPEIQELLEGMLNDEQTAEVLHRMSVSPEKLTEFRQHMALRGEMARDARGEGLTEEEDDRVWAAVLGATGGLVTGGTAVGSGVMSWLGRGAALLVTGIAGFFIGSAVSDGGNTPTSTGPATAAVEQNAGSDDAELPGESISAATEAGGATATDRIDTVYLTRTVVEPRVVYRDREKIVYREREGTDVNGLAAVEKESRTDAAGPEQSTNRADASNATASNVPEFGSYVPSTRHRASTPFIPADLLGADPVRVSVSSAEGGMMNSSAAAHSQDAAHDRIDGTNDPTSVASTTDPNRYLNNEKAQERSPKGENAELVDVPTLSLMQNRIEIGYAERLGRVAPAPEVQGRSEPSFDARSIDITYRDFDGRMGVGVRLLYGAFSEINYERELNFDLGIVDTLYVQTLGSSDEFNAQVFFNYRIPLGSERLALGLEASSGLSSRRFTLGGDASVIYLITDWLGAQAGVGLGSYWYTTEGARASVLEENSNAGITRGLPDDVQGTMVEGRYGLFYRF